MAVSVTKHLLVTLLCVALLPWHIAMAQPQDLKDAAAAEELGVSVETYRYLNLFGDIFERIREQYVEPVDDKDVIESAINGMLTSLDPHSSYLDTDSVQDMRVQTKGEFGGLGIEVTMDNGLIKVVSPIDETPAARAGVQAGDMIVRIDDEEVMGMSLSDAVDKMRGKVGTPIKVMIVREEEPEPLEIEIIRDVIKIRSVRHEIKGQNDVGYIRITTFNKQIEGALEKAIEEIKQKAGKNLQGFVLDLRNNPGGLLDQAIYVADAFMERGEIVSTRGREESSTTRLYAKQGDVVDGMPLVVLINGGSASASEIVAGALQDHRRAIIMGTKSFGKGSVQTIITLPGYGGAMRLTTARYYTPSGRSIQAEGIEPDILVEPANIEEVRSRFKRLKESDLRGALDSDQQKKAKKKRKKSTQKDDDKTKAEEEKPVDYQLLRAIDLIRGVSRYSEYRTQENAQKAPEKENESSSLKPPSQHE